MPCEEFKAITEQEWRIMCATLLQIVKDDSVYFKQAEHLIRHATMNGVLDSVKIGNTKVYGKEESGS